MQRTLRNMFIIVALSILTGGVLISLAYFLPTSRIYHNVERSVKMYERERDFPYWAGGVTHTRIDNFTDCIMLMKAMYPVENLIDSAFLNPSWTLKKNSPTKTLVNVFNQNEPAGENVWNYAQYWHGYLVILKPALMIAPIHELRVLNFYLQFFLAITALLFIYRRLGIYYFYAFMLALMVINPITTAINFQLSDVYHITILSVLFILIRNEFLLRGKNYLYFFLIIGILTAYIDFLTYPITALGLSLCMCILMNKEKFSTITPLEVFQRMSSYIFAWGFGYIGMWAGKWILASLLTGQNVMLDAFNAGIYRTFSDLNENEGAHSFTLPEVFWRSFEGLTRGPLTIILIILVIYLLYRLIIKKEKVYASKSLKVAFVMVVLLPFLWIAVFQNHSYVHDFMAYRNLSVSVFGTICFFIESLKERVDYV